MTISSQTRKAGPYTGNGSTTTFPFAFKVFVNTDVLVVRTDLSGVETVLTLGTDYTVSLNADQNSNAGGNVVLPTALTSGFLLTVGSKVPLLQQTDFTNQGGFYPAVLNASLDKLTILTQQLNEEVGRSAKLPISSTADADTLSAAILLVANDQTNIDAVAGDLANIDAVAGNETNIDTVAGISANVTTVAGIASDVTAVAGNATNITAVKNNATNINTVAGIASNVTTVAGISANVTTVAGNTTNINTNATNITAIQNASTNATNAANSATAAAASASAASTSETNAATSAAAAAASAASGMYSAVQDKSANYTVVAGDAGDLIRVNTSGGARTITLPAISTVTDGFKVAVVKWTGDANAVTIARTGSDTINGATSYALGNQYSSATFVADAETATWFAAASGLGTTNANVDVFSGNNSTVAFTLSGDAGSKNNTLVTIGGVYQAKSTYSLSGTTLTFSTAPPTGTSNIEVVWNSPLAIGTPSDDTVSTAKLQAGAVTTAKIADGNVTYAKIQNVTAGKVLGRDTSGAGVAQELPVAVNTNGDIGLGVSPSVNTLGKQLQIGQSTTLIAEVSANRFWLGSNWGYNGSDRYMVNGLAALYAQQDGTHKWWVAPSGVAGANVSFVDAMSIDNSGNVKINSGYGSSAIAYGCRAWANFTSTGTLTIRNKGNVSSITDNGNNFNINLTNAMPDSNYAGFGSAESGGSDSACEVGGFGSSSYTIWVVVGGSQSDSATLSTMIVR